MISILSFIRGKKRKGKTLTELIFGKKKTKVRKVVKKSALPKKAPMYAMPVPTNKIIAVKAAKVKVKAVKAVNPKKEKPIPKTKSYSGKRYKLVKVLPEGDLRDAVRTANACKSMGMAARYIFIRRAGKDVLTVYARPFTAKELKQIRENQ